MSKQVEISMITITEEKERFYIAIPKQVREMLLDSECDYDTITIGPRSDLKLDMRLLMSLFKHWNKEGIRSWLEAVGIELINEIADIDDTTEKGKEIVLNVLTPVSIYLYSRDQDESLSKKYLYDGDKLLSLTYGLILLIRLISIEKSGNMLANSISSTDEKINNVLNMMKKPLFKIDDENKWSLQSPTGMRYHAVTLLEESYPGRGYKNLIDKTNPEPKESDERTEI